MFIIADPGGVSNGLPVQFMKFEIDGMYRLDDVSVTACYDQCRPNTQTPRQQLTIDMMAGSLPFVDIVCG